MKNFLYIVKSDKQVNYTPNSAESTFNFKNAILQLIGIGLSVHQTTRNRNVTNLLSFFKMPIPYQQVVPTETAIPDTVS